MCGLCGKIISDLREMQRSLASWVTPISLATKIAHFYPWSHDILFLKVNFFLIKRYNNIIMDYNESEKKHIYKKYNKYKCIKKHHDINIKLMGVLLLTILDTF